MSMVHKETVDGVNDFINELKKDPSETILRLQTFNSYNFNVSVDFANINEIPEMKTNNFTPEGMTPLLDSVGRAINETHKFIESNNRDHSQVIFTVMTDGIENDLGKRKVRLELQVYGSRSRRVVSCKQIWVKVSRCAQVCAVKPQRSF